MTFASLGVGTAAGCLKFENKKFIERCNQRVSQRVLIFSIVVDILLTLSLLIAATFTLNGHFSLSTASGHAMLGAMTIIALADAILFAYMCRNEGNT